MNLSKIFANKNYRKKINRLVGSWCDLEIAWADETDDYYKDDLIKNPNLFEGNEKIYMRCARCTITENDGVFTYYDNEWGDEKIENPYDWISFSDLELDFSTYMLKSWCENYLDQKKIKKENVFFIEIEQTDYARYFGGTLFITIISNENKLDTKIKDNIVNYTQNKFYNEQELFSFIDNELSDNFKLIGFICNYEDYEDFLQTINYKKIYLLDNNKGMFNKMFSNNEFKEINKLPKDKEFNWPKEYYKFINENKLEDY